MVRQDVVSAFASQHRQNLMQAAQVSRMLHEGQNHSWKLNDNLSKITARYLKRFSSNRTRFSNTAKKDIKDEAGLVVDERFQSI